MSREPGGPEAEPGEGDGALSIQGIMEMIPHRYPFLLVDGIVRCEPGKSIRGHKNVTRSELPARGPSRLLPRYLILEALAQVALILTFRSLQLKPTGDELTFFAGIDDARFFGDVGAGDRLVLDCSIIRLLRSRGIGKFMTVASVGEQKVAEATMMAALQLPD